MRSPNLSFANTSRQIGGGNFSPRSDLPPLPKAWPNPTFRDSWNRRAGNGGVVDSSRRRRKHLRVGFNFRGLATELLDLADAGAFRLVVSEVLIDEVLDVLGRKFDWSVPELKMASGRMKKYAEIVNPAIRLEVVLDDEDDNRVLECAVAGNADFLVTGDRDLLRLREYEGIQIERIADFLRRVREEQT